MRQKCVRLARMRWSGSLGRGEQHFSVRSSLLRYGCRLCVRQRDAAFLYAPSESATGSLYMPSFSFFYRDLCRIDTNRGLPVTARWGFRCRMIVSQPNAANRNHGSPPLDGATNAKTTWSAQSQSLKQLRNPRPSSYARPIYTRLHLFSFLLRSPHSTSQTPNPTDLHLRPDLNDTRFDASTRTHLFLSL